MNRSSMAKTHFEANVPRGSGDEPLTEQPQEDVDVCSPRERG